MPPEPDDEHLREARTFLALSPAEQSERLRRESVAVAPPWKRPKRPRPDLERRGRPRSRPWVGRLGDFVSEYTCARLADELDLDPMEIGRWCRGDWAPSIQKAIAVVETARRAGVDLALDEVYSRHFARIRERLRSGDCGLPVRKAIAIVEIARARGIDLSLEDLYGQYFAQIRARIQSSLPPAVTLA